MVEMVEYIYESRREGGRYWRRKGGPRLNIDGDNKGRIELKR